MNSSGKASGRGSSARHCKVKRTETTRLVDFGRMNLKGAFVRVALGVAKTENGRVIDAGEFVRIKIRGNIAIFEMNVDRRIAVTSHPPSSVALFGQVQLRRRHVDLDALGGERGEKLGDIDRHDIVVALRRRRRDIGAEISRKKRVKLLRAIRGWRDVARRRGRDRRARGHQEKRGGPQRATAETRQIAHSPILLAGAHSAASDYRS